MPIELVQGVWRRPQKGRTQTFACGRCGTKNAGEVALQRQEMPSGYLPFIESVICVCKHCDEPSVLRVVDEDGQGNDKVTQQLPGRSVVGEVQSVPEPVRLSFQEARLAFAGGAYSSSALMCRKVLMNMAIDHGLPAKGPNNYAPNFKQCVKHIIDEGLLGAKMKTWLEKIRETGNNATHEVVPVGKEEAERSLRFCHAALCILYAFPTEIEPRQPEADAQAQEG